VGPSLGGRQKDLSERGRQRQRTTLDVRMNFFSVKTVVDWNNAPEAGKMARTRDITRSSMNFTGKTDCSGDYAKWKRGQATPAIDDGSGSPQRV
jgi:hypothetical protein